MSKIIKGYINLSKIPKDQVKESKEGNKFINVDIWINDEVDKYGNICSISLEQTKEQRLAKEARVYLGNGKELQPRTEESVPATPATSSKVDDLPF